MQGARHLGPGADTHAETCMNAACIFHSCIHSAQEPPFDWLEDDGALTAAQMADVRAAAAAWLDDGLYALLPYSSLLLTSVPAPRWTAATQRPLPRSAAAPRCGAFRGSRNWYLRA